MNVALGTRAFLPGFTLMAGLTGIAASTAYADVYKCRNSDGSLVYQEAPCESPGGKLKLPEPPVGTGKSRDKAKSPDPTNKAMNEAFQSRMDKQDYEGALAFATNDKQKSLARKRLEEKKVKCEGLSIKAQRARSDFTIKGARLKPAADAAESEYRLHCR